MRTGLVALIFGVGGLAAGLGIGLLFRSDVAAVPEVTASEQSARVARPSVPAPPESLPEVVENSPPADPLPPSTAETRPRLDALPPAGPERERMVRDFFSQFGRAEFDEALDHLGTLERKQDSDTALLAMTRSMLGVSDLEILRAAAGSSAGASPASIFAELLIAARPPDFGRAATVANSFTSGNERARLLGLGAAQLARTDPEAAQELGVGLSGSDYATFAGRLAAGWAVRDPQGAREWAMSLPVGAVRDAALAEAISMQAIRDPDAARRDLGLLPPGQVRTSAIGTIARVWAQRETTAALTWADSLADPAERTAAREGINDVAPSGIGARLSIDEYGFPRIADLVSGGAASSSGSLRNGDRITAIQDASGQWVEARDMAATDVVSRLRGVPGSPVTLRVAADEPGAAPRTITIYRQQITHEQRR